jgi:hypothetical protein
MEEEFASHLHLHINDNIRAGMTPNETRRRPSKSSAWYETSSTSVCAKARWM